MPGIVLRIVCGIVLRIVCGIVCRIVCGIVKSNTVSHSKQSPKVGIELLGQLKIHMAGLGTCKNYINRLLARRPSMLEVAIYNQTKDIQNMAIYVKCIKNTFGMV